MKGVFGRMGNLIGRLLRSNGIKTTGAEKARLLILALDGRPTAPCAPSRATTRRPSGSWPA